ncbi:MAG: hypothetical protein KAI47_23750, partial [Deltaproteobacteria bacterium]|nr:hypothetical protein [Deltaproteobacteria bacterium]
MSPKAIYSVRAVDGFTRVYVQALAASLVGRTVTRAEVCSVTRHEHGVDIAFEGGEVRGFDRVVFACGA